MILTLFLFFYVFFDSDKTLFRASAYSLVLLVTNMVPPLWFLHVVFLNCQQKDTRHNLRRSNKYQITRVPKFMLFLVCTFRQIQNTKYPIVNIGEMYAKGTPHHKSLSPVWYKYIPRHSKHKLWSLVIWWRIFTLKPHFWQKP